MLRVSICAHIGEEECQGDATRRDATQRDESVHLRSPSVISPSRPSSSTLASLARKLALCDQASDSLRRVRRPSLRPSVRASVRDSASVRPFVSPACSSTKEGGHCSESASTWREKGVTDLAQEFDCNIVARMCTFRPRPLHLFLQQLLLLITMIWLSVPRALTYSLILKIKADFT